MSERKSTKLGRGVLLALLTLYALAMILPDFARIVRPLGSFGLTTNADGVIHDVQGPFTAEDESPAWRAGLRVGDHLDLEGMRCVPVDTEICASNLALWGGVTYVMPGREATLLVKASGEQPGREVKLIAEPRPRTLALGVVTLLDQIAGALVVLGAAYLVWIRPGAMTWALFAHTIQFDPGQSFQFYAWLQQWPRALLAQDVASCVLQAAGYTGLLLFALRAPVDRCEGRWRGIERALPALTILFLAVALMSLGTAFGYPTEFAMRASILIGFAVSAAALGILIGRRRDLSPRDYQRIRWVIWGCLIGLPAYLIAEISQETSLPASLFGEAAVTEDLSGLFYLVNGILCVFVVEAVRRPTVVSVWIPLRRATVLGLLLSAPAFFVREELSTINEWTRLPDWAWVAVASVLVFLIARARMDHRTRGPAVRPGLPPRGETARRRRRGYSARRKPRRHRTPFSGRADARPASRFDGAVSRGRWGLPAARERGVGRSERRYAPGRRAAARRTTRRRAALSPRWVRRRRARRAPSRRSGAPRSRRARRQSASPLRGRPLRRPRSRHRPRRRRARPLGRPRPRRGDRLWAG